MNTGENKQEKQEVEWLVQFPDKEKVTRFVRPSLEAACYGNERIASILNYFLYEAVREAKNQRLEKGCKVVAFERKHKDITDRLKFPLSRKTLIRYLDLLNEWGYVTSERYQKTFTVNHDTIQEAINNPPTKPVKYQWLQEKSCKVVDIQPLESCTDTTLSDPKKVVELQQKVEYLQQKVEYLQQKVDIFTTLQPYLEAWIQAAGMPLSESLRNISNNHNISSSNIVVSANASTTPPEDKTQENSYSREPQQATLLEVESKEETPTGKTSSPRGKKKTSKVPEVQQEIPAMPPEDAPWTPATIRGMFNHWRGHVPLTQGTAVQQNNAANTLYEANYTREQITRVYGSMCKQQYWVDRGGVEIWNVANNIAREWNKIKGSIPSNSQASTIPEQKPVVEPDQNKPVVWTRYKHQGAPIDHWYLYAVMPLSEALSYGYKADMIPPSYRQDIKTLLKALAEGHRELTPEQKQELETAELRPQLHLVA